MGKKRKLMRFAETHNFPHFFQISYEEALQGFQFRGNWKGHFFKNENPIVLELGCGKGEYTVGLARKYPQLNFIGIDVKGARMWKGARTSFDEKLPNVAFLRTRIELIDLYFGSEEVSEIWITFPDPHLRQSRARKRLTHPNFLNRYRTFLVKDHIIHLKTDSPELYQFTMDVIRFNNFYLDFQTADLYHQKMDEEATAIQTYYEKIWLEAGLNIHYIRFRIDPFAKALPMPVDNKGTE